MTGSFGGNNRRASTEATLVEIRDALIANADGDSTSDIVNKLDDVITELQATHNVTIDSASITALSTAYDAANSAIETSLQDVANTLNDILNELMQKIDAGEDVGLTDEAVTALATAIATLFHYPTDYPDATSSTKLGSILAAITLQNTYVDGLEANTAGTNTKLDSVIAAITLQNTYVDGVETQLGTLHTDVTGGTQRTKITDGTNNASVVVGDTNGAVSAYASKLITFTSTGTGAQEMATTDCLGYEWAFVYVVNQGSGATVVAQLSDDGSTNWGLTAQFDPSALAVAPVSFTTLQSGGAGYIVPLSRRWLRLHGTALSSGTFSGTITLHTSPLPALPGYRTPVTPSGTFAVDTELAAAAAGADTFANPTTAPVLAANQGYNGSTWDRLRSGATVYGTATGRLAVAPNPTSFLSLNAVTSAIAGSRPDPGTTFSKWALQVTTTGGPATLTVVLEGNLDGSSNYTLLTTWTLGTQTNGETIWVQDKLAQFVRARVTALTGGTSPAVTAYIVGGVG